MKRDLQNPSRFSAERVPGKCHVCARECVVSTRQINLNVSARCWAEHVSTVISEIGVYLMGCLVI